MIEISATKILQLPILVKIDSVISGEPAKFLVALSSFISNEIFFCWRNFFNASLIDVSIKFKF